MSENIFFQKDGHTVWFFQQRLQIFFYSDFFQRLIKVAQVRAFSCILAEERLCTGFVGTGKGRSGFAERTEIWETGRGKAYFRYEVQAQTGIGDWMVVAGKMEVGACVGQVDGWSGRSGCHGRAQGAFLAPCCSPNFGFAGWDQCVDCAGESGHSDVDFVGAPEFVAVFSVRGCSVSGFWSCCWCLDGSVGGKGCSWMVEMAYSCPN